MSESEFVRHEPCLSCGSSDANSLYSDGHSFCFSCNTYTPGEDAVEHIHQMTTAVSMRGSAERLHKRRISEKVCKQYHIHKDGQVLRFYYFSESGVLEGCKSKTKDKLFTYEGNVPGTLFGQHLFPATGKRVVITEGELDAASCQEAMPGWPMVSLPSGCLLYTSPSPRDKRQSRMPSSA